MNHLEDDDYKMTDKNKEKDTEKDNSHEEFDLFKKIKKEDIFKSSRYLFELKILFSTELLFKYLIEVDIEKIQKSLLNFKLLANYDINAKNLLSFILDYFITDDNSYKEMLKKIKDLICFPFNQFKYDLTDKNKNEINSRIADYLERDYISGDLEFMKELCDSEKWLEVLFEFENGEEKKKEKIKEFKEIVELFY